ncbi:ABC transporter permease [Sediminibacterium sp.]|uniref:ABC transporter permease n=1 Tax=Sediminibacterium sp. TaxID=1917865 RepID=UPI002732C6C1|nr:FtsX-like permease family protein [Sediminibacterium sp.]MDP3394014.1 ABC transporter permease [Sediminibacterium sp.]MDP3566789.1 ABC transporter permease [Sediminibacterium sp.]
MNFSLFIAQRLAFSKQQSFSRFIIRLSVGATTVGIAAMIITLCFVNGFQQTVADKVYSFWGHIRVQHFEPDKSMMAEEVPINRDKNVEKLIASQKEVSKIQAFATKSAVLEFHKNIEGVLLKGIEANYDSSRIKPFITRGKWIQFLDSSYSKEIMVSEQIASLLNIALHDTVTVYFVGTNETNTSYRKLTVAGFYKTGIEEYDKVFLLADLKLIARINNWTEEQIGGYEIFIDPAYNKDTVSQQLMSNLPTEWMSRTVASIYPNIFDWLEIQNMNRNVIFIIMAVVAIINMISCLLILILERTRMIGVFKALGAKDRSIIQIFLYYAAVIALRGIIGGFIIGMGLVLIQQYTGFISLDESSYYVKTAPVQIIWWQIITVCVTTFVVSFVVMLIPALLVKKVNPIKAIQFR